MSIAIMPNPKIQYFDASGNPLAGGKVYTYEPSTTTAKATYTDSTGLVANANPTILDSAGRASIWLNGYYKVVLTDSADNVIWTIDNISAMPDTALYFTEWSAHAGAPTYVDADTFSVSGDYASTFHANRRVRATIGTGYIYGTISAVTYSAPNTVVDITWDSTTLDNTLSQVDYGALSATNTSIPNSVVTLTGTQTLTNKTLTSPTINTPTLSGGTLTGSTLATPTVTNQAATGGSLTDMDLYGCVVDVRMCVQQAVLDSNGRNNAISAGTGLACNLAATATPYVVTAPYGNSSTTGLPLDYRTKETADITGAWSSLTDSTTCYLYYKRTNAGVWSRSFTTLAPAFGWGTAERPAGPSSGQLYYDISKAKWDLYTASWAEQTDTYVFVGQCVTAGGAVTSVINYAIKGKYDSGDFAVAATTAYSKTTAIGAPFLFKILLDGNDYTTTWWNNNVGASYGAHPNVAQTNTTISFVTGGYVGIFNGAAVSSGNYRVIAWRRF